MLLSAARMKMDNQKGVMRMENQRTKLAKGQPDSTTTAVVTWQMDADNVIALKNGRKLETATSLFATPITRLQYLKLMAPDRSFAATFCCENNEFNDCNLCKSFVVWDFTVDEDSHGGDITMEKEYKNNMDTDGSAKYSKDSPPPQDAMKDSDNTNAGKIFMQNDWRDLYYGQSLRQVERNGKIIDYPEYAYDNLIHPAGFARATLREFNDPPVCVYVPNVGGRVIEVKVEPEESGSQVCVDDLHEDSLERNAPGVTQACDDSRLQTCFPDANTSEESAGFAFLISCAESCADSDLDLWFRVRSSINRWVDNGKYVEGQGEVAPT
eukprot:UN26530